MDNPLVGIMHAASLCGWCVSTSCTTCGSREFRAALDRLAGEQGDALADALMQLDPDSFVQLRNWAPALEIAFGALAQASQQDAVLSAWLPKAGQCPRFDDVVLFRLLRWRSKNNEVVAKWLAALIPYAVSHRDASLVESLLLVLRRSAALHPELVRVATELAAGSRQMRRVLNNTVGPTRA